MKRLAIFITLLLMSLVCANNAHADLVEGKNYLTISNSGWSQSGDRIEVMEFFWYGCSHCNNLHPYLKKWVETAPADVDFKYVPAIFRKNWVPAAKLFYSINAIGAMDALHDNIYNAIHQNKINLHKEPVLFNWIKKQGVDLKKFQNAYKSFTVQSQVAKSTQMTRQYKLTGVPSLIVGGKYVTSGGMTHSPQETIKVLGQLIDKVRKERTSQ